MIQNLRLTQNAQFFRIVSPLTDDFIRTLLDAASANIQPNQGFLVDIVNLTERLTTTSRTPYSVSVRVYPSRREVLFIEPPLFDTIYAYIVLIEIGPYAAILSKSCASISNVIESSLEHLDPKILNSSVGDKNAEIQKVSLRNMAVSSQAIQSKTFEASNLKGILNPLTARRSIAKYARVKSFGKTKSLTSGTSRIVETAVRKEADAIAEWVNEQIKFFENPTAKSTFFEKFAETVISDEVFSQSEPNGIHVEVHRLFELIDAENLDIYYENSSGKIKKASQRLMLWLFTELEATYNIENSYIMYGRKRLGKLTRTNNGLSFSNKVLSRFKLKEDGKFITLQNFVKRNRTFIVTFTNPTYLYFSGLFYKDASIKSSIDDVLDILVVRNELLNVTSEKGGKLANLASDFPLDSVFKQVEIIHQNDDVILCDDLGNEWADHLSFNFSDQTISFIHSKHGNTSSGASQMHDVVGQGIKNLGNMNFTIQDLTNKQRTKFSRNYSNTQIQRVRKLSQGKVVSPQVNSLVTNYRTLRKCILCCSFLSKQLLHDEFKKLKRGTQSRGEIVQLLWIMLCFRNEAKEMSIEPVIYCKP